MPNSAFGRLKRAVRAAIAACGAIDGATATVEKSRSLVGSWNNLNQHDMPCLPEALAMDEVAIATGNKPPILYAYAAELGHVALRLPDVSGVEHDLMQVYMRAASEFGDVSKRLSEAFADQRFCDKDAAKLIQETDEAIHALVVMRAVAARVAA